MQKITFSKEKVIALKWEKDIQPTHPYCFACKN